MPAEAAAEAAADEAIYHICICMCMYMYTYV